MFVSSESIQGVWFDIENYCHGVFVFILEYGSENS